jgi:hypothetical protein
MQCNYGAKHLRCYNDDLEIDRLEDVPPKEEEDEELEPASDEDRGEIFDTDSEDDA